MNIDSATVLRGVVYSLEIAVLFLRDANVLYGSGKAPSACVLGVIAAERVGDSNWLWSRLTELRRGDVLECQRFKRKVDHVQRLRDGLVVSSANVPDSLSLTKLDDLDPSSREHKEYLEKFWKVTMRMHKMAPSGHHKLRERAQYVDFHEGCQEWSRPAAVSRKEVHDMLLDVGNSFRTTLLRLLQDQELENLVKELGLRELLENPKHIWPAPEGNRHLDAEGDSGS